MRHLAILPVAILTAGLCTQAMPAHAEGQYGAKETLYFSCSTTQHKAISLCGDAPSALQYRYGKPPRVELAFPDNPADGAKQLFYAHYERFQVERSEVTFSHANVDYAVFDYTEHGRRSTGVHITMPDGSEHEVHCAGPIKGRLSALAKSLHCDADNALNGDNCP